MCYMPAEILDSAHGVNVRYIGFFLAGRHVTYPFHKPGWAYISTF
jgi:hypothetical protein